MVRKLTALAALSLMAVVPSLARAAEPGVVNFCAAKKGGNYDYSAQQFAAQAKGVLRINIINKAGSLDILDAIDRGECDAGVVQSDALPVYKAKNPGSQLSLEVGAGLYPELLHFICNTDAGLSKITGLNKDMTVFVGANGSGTSVTWESFKLADPKRYGPIPTLPLEGSRAANKVKIGGAEGTCMMYVSGLKSSDMNDANELAKQASGKLRLVPTNDSDLLKLRAPGKNGAALYQEAEIPSGTYPGGLQPASLFGSSVKTIAVTATFVASSKYVDEHSKEYDTLLTAVNKATPSIRKKVEPQ